MSWCLGVRGTEWLCGNSEELEQLKASVLGTCGRGTLLDNSRLSYSGEGQQCWKAYTFVLASELAVFQCDFYVPLVRIVKLLVVDKEGSDGPELLQSFSSF